MVSCNAFFFIELLSVQFFTHSELVEISFHFIEDGGGGRAVDSAMALDSGEMD